MLKQSASTSPFSILCLSILLFPLLNINRMRFKTEQRIAYRYCLRLSGFLHMIYIDILRYIYIYKTKKKRLSEYRSITGLFILPYTVLLLTKESFIASPHTL